MKDTLEHKGVRIALMVGIAGVIFFGWSQHIIHPGSAAFRCSDFAKYEDALKAYEGGASYLDGDSDRIPCEALYHKK